MNVGGATELEIREKKMRVEDAVHATRAALEEGVIHGSGVAYLRPHNVLPQLKAGGDDEPQGFALSPKRWPNRSGRSPTMAVSIPVLRSAHRDRPPFRLFEVPRTKFHFACAIHSDAVMTQRSEPDEPKDRTSDAASLYSETWRLDHSRLNDGGRSRVSSPNSVRPSLLAISLLRIRR